MQSTTEGLVLTTHFLKASQNIALKIERKMGKLTRSLPFLYRTDPCRLLLESSDSLLELIHTSAGVNKLLLTGEERMALGANFNFDLAALGGLGLYGFAACASDDALFVLRMDSLFH